MHSLTANDAIRIWETGHREPSGPAVSLLAAAFPEAGRAELRGLTIGESSERLWELRHRIFGSDVNGFSECATCGERLEFTLDTKDLRLAEGPTTAAVEFMLESGDYSVRFRLLTLQDLEASSGNSVDSVRTRLIECCILEALHKDRVVTVSELPETVVAQLGQRLAEFDSGAELIVELACPACESNHQLPFDIASFLFMEIGAQARRLMHEVHVLARAYGWREEAILGMSARRRQFYLDLLDR